MLLHGMGRTGQYSPRGLGWVFGSVIVALLEWKIGSYIFDEEVLLLSYIPDSGCCSPSSVHGGKERCILTPNECFGRR